MLVNGPLRRTHQVNFMLLVINLEIFDLDFPDDYSDAGLVDGSEDQPVDGGQIEDTSGEENEASDDGSFDKIIYLWTTFNMFHFFI